MSIEMTKRPKAGYVSIGRKTIRQRAKERIINENILLKKKIRRIEALSEIDELTEVGNVRRLKLALKSRGDEMTRWSQPLSIIFIDVNDLKKINDNKEIGGHKAGDEAIVGVARKLKSMIRSYDTLCRKGGDEFVIVAVDDEDESNRFVERLREEFHSNPVMVRGNPVSISIGKDTLHDENKIDRSKIDSLIEDLVDSADKNMYKDKRRQKAER